MSCRTTGRAEQQLEKDSTNCRYFLHPQRRRFIRQSAARAGKPADHLREIPGETFFPNLSAAVRLPVGLLDRILHDRDTAIRKPAFSEFSPV